MKRFFKIVGCLLLIPMGSISFFTFFIVSWLFIKSPIRIKYEGYTKTLNDVKISKNVAKKLFSEFIPNSATDIRYCVYPYAQDLIAVFFISQEDFESWLSQKMTTWKLEKISEQYVKTIIRFSYYGDGDKWEIPVESKVYYEGKKHEKSNIVIIYDEKQKLCYIQYD
jgi:hypothetical protein